VPSPTRPRRPSHLVRVSVNKEALIDAYHAFLTDPRPARRAHHDLVLTEGGVPPVLLDALLLEGEPSREDVAALVSGLLAESVRVPLRYVTRV
jgi:hypothetical protein